MNFLTDKLPTAVKVGDKVYKVNADFRACLKSIMAFEDSSLTMLEKQEICLYNLYGKNIPEDVETAYNQAIKFLNCGEEATKDSEEPSEPSLGRLYSFSRDGNYIFTAIKSSFGIDLESTDFLHWWKFVALFGDINSKCFFKDLLYLRSQKRKGKLTKEEREWYLQIKDIVDMPEDDLTAEDENMKEFMAALEGGTLEK